MIAQTLHPDTCTIKGYPGFGWAVECKGVPLHHYETTPARHDCVTFEWNVDAWGRPYNAWDIVRSYASIQDECRKKASYEADQEKISRRGLKTFQ